MEAACSSLLAAAIDFALPPSEEDNWQGAACQKFVQLSFLVDILEKFVTDEEVKLARRTLKELCIDGMETPIKELREKGEYFTFCFEPK